MQTIVCFVLILTVSVAEDLDVYVYNSYNDYINQHETAKPVRSPPFKFEYHGSDMLSMYIYFKNIPSNVSADFYLKYPSGVNTEMAMKKLKRDNKRVKYFKFSRLLKYRIFIIEVEIFTTSGFCTRKIIAKGRKVSDSSEKTNNTPYPDACLTSEPCVIEVDLLNNICGNSYKPDGPTTDPSLSTDQTWAQENKETTIKKNTDTSDKSGKEEQLQPLCVVSYVVASVIVMCVTILMIYKCVKKIRHRNSHPVESMELKTYATANEVLYADLSLAHGNSELPRREEESPYAQIIGVMKPDPH